MLTKNLPIKSFGRYSYPPSKKQDKPLKKLGCFNPFGLEHQKADNTASSSIIVQNFKLNGVELNTDIKLYEMEYRQYDASVGRFTSIDPVMLQMLSYENKN
ncbi:hypothetical protein OAC51_09770 [Flavobacteriaceae bacterium]|nr:hypothetical protein [Flavobacteriaceae bacterium]